MIQIDNLTRRYGRRVGVESVRLEVQAGSLFGFLGPNGSGKTTTIRVLLGFLRPSEGRAAVLGLDCWRESRKIKEEVGYVPGDLRLYSWLTCREAIRIWGQARRRDLTAEGRRLAEVFELEPDVPVRKMSRGMRQKLGLILALAHRPKLLVLDEPTTALDPIMQERFYDELRSLARAGHTVFFSSHTLGEVDRLCDRVAILRRGKLVADETLDALRARAARIVTVRFAGTDSISDRPPDCLHIVEREGRSFTATLEGDVSSLLRWAVSMPIEDISIGRPDLGRLFQEYYADGEGDD